MMMMNKIDLRLFFTEEEWEKICDHCGICCLYKIEDYDTGEYIYTRIACPFLDIEKGNCISYLDRFHKMPTCAKISAETLEIAHIWMPRHCAYRCLYERRPLPPWHPLFTQGNEQSNAQLLSKITALVTAENDIEMCSKEKILSIRKSAIQMNPGKKIEKQLVANVIKDIKI